MGELLRNRTGAVVGVVLVVVLLSASRIASVAVDLMWFTAIGYRPVFTTILTTEIVVGLVAGLLLAALIAVNLQVARRMRPLFVPSTPQQAAVDRYRDLADPYLPWLIAGVAVLFGATSGFALATEWETVLLWLNGGSFGITDEQFGRDLGYYVFDLPFLKTVQSWVFTSLLLTGFLTVGAHYLLGGIRPESPGEKVLPNVKAHLSVLLALILAARGWGYWLDRFLLNFSPRGQVTGASYTDVNAELPALNLLLVATVVAIGLVIYNVRRRGFLLPGAAIALLVLASIFLQGAYPAAIQRLRVEPQELTRESPFIDRNLTATLDAYALDGVELQPFEIDNDFDAAEAQENEVTLTNIRLWDPEVLQTTYRELQALRPYYAFNDVDVDRYVIDDEVRQVMLATRELERSGLPDQAQTWQNRVLTYTQGFGIVASRVNTANSEGQPVFLVDDIPPGGVDPLLPSEQASIYYGEDDNPTYSVVDTLQDELQYEDPQLQRQITTSYDGEGGVVLSNLARRLAFAIEFADPNMILSDLLTDESKILFRRDVADRVSAVAPFLALDEDPYPVVLEDRIYWVQDAYTTSAFYPYSERSVLDTGQAQTVNYVRNSVKAVVDAYDGTVSLYVIDDEDPVLAAWRSAFPGSFSPMSEAPEGLEDHFRYPQDLFELQAQIYTSYHIPNVPAFYSKADEWDIPRNAPALENDPSLRPETTPLNPYYLLMRLPGEQDEEFVLIQPYLANNRPNMIAWLAARSDPEQYGELFAVQFPSDQQVLGPQQVQARIEQEDDISAYITLRSQAGSEVIRGNLLVLPIADSILYVEPLFLESPQAEIPELARVVLVLGDRVVFERTLAEAVGALVGVEVSAPIDTGDEEGVQPPDGQQQEQQPGGTTVEVDQLLLDALEAFTEAEAALEAGDLGEYQRLLDEAQQLVTEAVEEEGLAPPEDAAPQDGGGQDGGDAGDGGQGGAGQGGAEPSEPAPSPEEAEG